jgi:4-hydroxy 2-oxovalerate aldolase
MAGVYQAHPNNIIYLTKKFRLRTKDIKKIISMIDPEKRQRYDYDNIERLYIEYGRDIADDEESVKKISEEIQGKKVLVLVPGHTLTEYEEKIREFIQTKDIVIISVNYITNYDGAYAFWGNKRRYDVLPDKQKQYPKNIICSNVHKQDGNLCVVNYFGLINRGYRYFDNLLIYSKIFKI